MECGQTVARTRPAAIRRTPKSSQPTSRIAIWMFALLGVLAIFWATSGNRVDVQRLREKYLAPPHAESLGEKAFSISARGFASNKFTIPSGASNVLVIGQFGVTGNSGDEIEVYVLSDEAFVTWRNGYSTSTYYDSGKVLRGNLHAVLPDDDGTYYLVFSNNVSRNTAKTVRADVSLQYRRWAPDWFYRMKEAF
jgi:hypothetical protein